MSLLGLKIRGRDGLNVVSVVLFCFLPSRAFDGDNSEIVLECKYCVKLISMH